MVACGANEEGAVGVECRLGGVPMCCWQFIAIVHPRAPIGQRNTWGGLSTGCIAFETPHPTDVSDRFVCNF